MIWKSAAPHWTLQVQSSFDGKLLVTAHMDGTVRWWRAADGKELLALFVHPATLDWVLWTPAGYYDCSLRAEEWLKWQVNRGLDKAATTYPIGEFRERFYRPDVVDRILTAGDESVALYEASLERFGQPENPMARGPFVVDLPAVNIERANLDREGAGYVLDIAVTCSPREGQSIKSIEVQGDFIQMFVERIEQSEANVAFTWEKNISWALPIKRVQVLVDYGTGFTELQIGVSNARSITFEGEPARTGPHTLHVLAVGVNTYPNATKAISALRFAEDDAKAFAAEFKARAPTEYSRVNPKVLIGAQVTAAILRATLVEMCKDAKPLDLFLFYFSGHGLANPSDPYEYLYPLFDYNPNVPAPGSLSAQEIAALANEVSQCRRLVVLDTCFAEKAIDGFIFRVSDPRFGLGVFAGSGTNGVSREGDGNGYFTRAIIDALRLAGPGLSSRITAVDLQARVQTAFNSGAFAQTGQNPRIDIRKFGDKIVIAENRPASSNAGRDRARSMRSFSQLPSLDSMRLPAHN